MQLVSALSEIPLQQPSVLLNRLVFYEPFIVGPPDGSLSMLCTISVSSYNSALLLGSCYASLDCNSFYSDAALTAQFSSVLVKGVLPTFSVSALHTAI